SSRTKRCSGQGGHFAVARFNGSPGRPAAELGRSATKAEVRMAILIRFNTLIVRKSSIEAKYPGGLDAYRGLYLPRNAHLYYEDRHLIAHTSMGGFYGEPDRLAANGLVFSPGDASSDYCFANEVEGVKPSCQWLEVQSVGGALAVRAALVCW